MFVLFKSKRKMQKEIERLNDELAEAREETERLLEMTPSAEEFYYSYVCTYCKNNLSNGHGYICKIAPHKCRHFEAMRKEEE